MAGFRALNEGSGHRSDFDHLAQAAEEAAPGTTYCRRANVGWLREGKVATEVLKVVESRLNSSEKSGCEIDADRRAVDLLRLGAGSQVKRSCTGV
jgi:hypothetical protein